MLHLSDTGENCGFSYQEDRHKYRFPNLQYLTIHPAGLDLPTRRDMLSQFVPSDMNTTSLASRCLFRRTSRSAPLPVYLEQGLFSLEHIRTPYAPSGSSTEEHIVFRARLQSRKEEIGQFSAHLQSRPSCPSPSGPDLYSKFDQLVYLVIPQSTINVHQLAHVFSACNNVRGFSGNISHDEIKINTNTRNNSDELLLMLKSLEKNKNRALKTAFAKAKNLQEVNITIEACLVPVLEALAHVKYIKVTCRFGRPLRSPRGPPCRTEVLCLNFITIGREDVQEVIRTLQCMLRPSCIIDSSSGRGDFAQSWWASFRHTWKRWADIAYDLGPRFSPLPIRTEVNLQTLDQDLMDNKTALRLH